MSSFITFARTTLDRIKKLIKKHPYLTSALLALVAVLIGFAISRRHPRRRLQTLMLSDFIDALNNNLVQEVVVKSPSSLVFKTMIGSFLTDTSLMPKQQLFNMLVKKRIKYKSSTRSGNNGVELADMAVGLGCFLASVGLSFFIILKQRAEGKYKFNQENEAAIRFKDIYGLQKPKQILQETLDYLAHPKKYEDIGCRLRRGIIFYGPPGTGKTMLAKAMATESNSKFISCSAAQFCQMYVGIGPKRIRQLFENAKKYKSAIIFIDEIDAIGRRKEERESDTERNNTLNQLLVQMDGFISNSRVVVIAATNRIEMIDSALLRSGRFDLKIEIPLPSESERKGILDLHLSKKSSHVPEKLLNQIAAKSEGMCGADLENLANEAAYKALRKNKSQISQTELEEAFEQMRQVASKRRV